MSHKELVLRVRFRSKLTLDEVMEIVEERAPEFEALTGLRQKYYLQDPATGEIAGLYIWDDEEALREYQESELRATIAQAYQTEGPPDVELYKVLKFLREEEG